MLPPLLLPGALCLLPAEGITLPAPDIPLPPTSAPQFFPLSPAPGLALSIPLLPAPLPHTLVRARQENTAAKALILRHGWRTAPGAPSQSLPRPPLAHITPT